MCVPRPVGFVSAFAGATYDYRGEQHDATVNMHLLSEPQCAHTSQ